MECVNTNDIGNHTNFEELKEEYRGNHIFTFILNKKPSEFIDYQHKIIFSLHISEMLHCISSNLHDGKALLVPRLYLQSNDSFKVENRVFNDSQKTAYSKILDCVPYARVFTSLDSGKLFYS